VGFLWVLAPRAPPAGELCRSAEEDNNVTVTPNPSGLAVVRVLLRTWFLGLAIGLPAASLDVLTTELARRDGDFVELNPAGFVPLSTAFRNELLWILLGTASMLIGAYACRAALDGAIDSSLDQFFESLFARNAWAVPLLWMPFFASMLRYLVVISNSCYLSVGWSPIDKVLLLPLQALFHDDAAGYVASTFVCILVLWYPANALIVRAWYRIHRWGRVDTTPNKAVNPSGGSGGF